MPDLSERAVSIKSSPIADQMAEARRMIQNGLDVIDLTVGETDAETPDNAKKAAIRAIREGKTRYTAADGTPELKEALAKKFGVHTQNVCVSNGAKTILHVLFETILNPKDKVILPAPYWPCFMEAVRMTGAEACVLPSVAENNYLLTAAQLETVLFPNTKALILNSPCNPSGQAYTESEFLSVARFCKQHDIFLIYDGSYADLVFDSEKAPSPFDFGDEFSDISVCVGSSSKAWAMSGWRIGWSIAPASVSSAMSRYLNNCIGNPSSVSQAAFLAALQDTEPTEKIRSVCRERCRYVESRISALSGLSCLPSKGGLYVFVKLENGMDDLSFSGDLLKARHLAVVAGSAFGYPGYFRISCSKPLPVLQDAMDRLESYITERL